MKLNKGDIFKVDKKDGNSFFFQYLADDEYCLSGNVIRVFDWDSSFDDEPDIEKLLKEKVKFYAHVSIKRGLNEGNWSKIANCPLDNSPLPSFKHYEAVDFIPGIQEGWAVWQVDGKEKYLGKKISKKYEILTFAAIRPPEKIIQWFEENKDPFIPQKN